MPDETREQNHLVMQAGASRPVAGPAADAHLAASGGLEVPGREAHPFPVGDGAAPHEPIPGERDPATLTHREAGALGTFNGAELSPTTPALDDEKLKDVRREGGGRS